MLLFAFHKHQLFSNIQDRRRSFLNLNGMQFVGIHKIVLFSPFLLWNRINKTLPTSIRALKRNALVCSKMELPVNSLL